MTIETKFVKIMMPDLMERMKLPSDYCEKLKEEKSKKAVLKTPKGRWEVNLRRDEDGEIFFEDGWPRFAHDHALNAPDILVFQHMGNLHFNVVVSDKTMCEIDCWNQDSHTKINKGKVEKKAIVSLHSQRPCFTKEIKAYTASKAAMVNIPLGIVRPNNLASKNGIILRDPGRKTWALNLVVQKDARGLRVLMRKGWHDFYVANELKVGDLCLFELSPTSSSTSTSIIFDVHIFRI